MKKMNLKKSIAALSAAAMVMCPMALNMASSTMPVYAASFISAPNSDGAITIDESQIQVKVTPYNFAPKVEEEANVVNKPAFHELTYSLSNLPILGGDIQISMNISTTASEKSMRSFRLNCRSYLDSKNITNKTYTPESVTKRSNGSYDLVFRFPCVGNRLVMTSTYLCSDHYVNSASYYTNAAQYLTVSATCPNGENILARIPRSTASDAQIKTWAKRMCVYANSLKDVTGISRGTVLLNFDDMMAEPDETVGRKGAYGFYDSTLSSSEYAYTGYCIHASSDAIDTITSNRNEMTWALMHEISHAYCGGNFDKYYNYSDEVNTNVRGLTAIQNCTNLRNMNLRMLDGTADTYRGIMTFNTALDSDPLMAMAKQTIRLGHLYGWDALEKYLKADSGTEYNTDENKAAAEALITRLNLNVTTSSTRFMKLVNNLRAIYKNDIFYATQFNANSFASFVEANYGRDLIYKFINSETITGKKS